MRVIVCGSRGWQDAFAVLDVLLNYRTCFGTFTIIEGEASGPDSMARDIGKALGLPSDPYPANWRQLGKAAGYARNWRMVKDGRPDLVVAFWDGRSRGTVHTIQIARHTGLQVVVISPQEVNHA